MPLPPPTSRRELHHRAIECRGYERDDGLFDIDARVTDRRTYALVQLDGRVASAGAPVHDMWLRLTVDSQLVIHDVIASTDASPYAVCPGAAVAMRRLVGEHIGPGFTRQSRALLGGAKGCTHLVELLGPAATTAYQTLVRQRNAASASPGEGRPAKIDSCHAYAAGGELVRQLWPLHHSEAG
jgi:hypothetical protein